MTDQPTNELPNGWAWTGPLEATASIVGVTTTKVAVCEQGIEVDVEDDTRNYTSGSYTNAEIPWEVLNALVARWNVRKVG